MKLFMRTISLQAAVALSVALLFVLVSIGGPHVQAQEIEADICREGFVLNDTSTVCIEESGSQSGSEIEEDIQDGPLAEECLDKDLTTDNCGIIGLLADGINFLTAVAGMAIIGSIMFGGYQYMTARDNAGAVQAARTRIIWAIVAMLMLIFMYAFLQWLVPGGVL